MFVYIISVNFYENINIQLQLFTYLLCYVTLISYFARSVVASSCQMQAKEST